MKHFVTYVNDLLEREGEEVLAVEIIVKEEVDDGTELEGELSEVEVIAIAGVITGGGVFTDSDSRVVRLDIGADDSTGVGLDTGEDVAMYAVLRVGAILEENAAATVGEVCELEEEDVGIGGAEND